MDSTAYGHRKIFQININAENLITHRDKVSHISTVLYNIHPKKWVFLIPSGLTLPQHCKVFRNYYWGKMLDGPQSKPLPC